MSDSSTWHIAYTKLRFFTRIKRFLHLKSSNKQHEPSDHQSNKARVGDIKRDQETRVKKIEQKNNISEEEEYRVVLQRSVKRLHFGSWEEKEVAAGDIKRLAGEDLKHRKTMAELGVIPPLVEMVESDVVARRRLALQTLVELANGNYTNKALIMETGILSKLPENIGVLEEQTRHDFAQLIMSISSLANTQFPLNSSKIIPFVVTILESDSNWDTKELCLGRLYNLSTMLDNATSLVTNEVIDNLLKMSSTSKETSEKALATLGNLVVTLMGKKALENNSMVPESLIEVMTWEEKPKSQELCAYILMILAHQSPTQRLKMVNAGIVSVLLQVSLLSTPLAQKRALRLLQWFKEERLTKIAPHSGPQTRRLSVGSPINHREVSEGKKLMKNMVKQSLYKNMESMARRANGDDSSSKLKLLVVSTSSKSLPY